MSKNKITKQADWNVVAYSGTTDANGTLIIPLSVVSALTSHPILSYATGAYPSAPMATSDGTVYIRFSLYNGQPATNTDVAVLLLLHS